MSRSTALPASSGVGRALSEFPFLYRALRTPVRGVLERWFRLRVEGAEHLPECGPYLVAANHHNYLDGVVLGVSVPAPLTLLGRPCAAGASTCRARRRWPCASARRGASRRTVPAPARLGAT